MLILFPDSINGPLLDSIQSSRESDRVLLRWHLSHRSINYVLHGDSHPGFADAEDKIKC